MALIPAGSFQMGSERTDDEKPIHTVTLNAFEMDVYEVTNARYAECVAAGPCQPPEMDTFGTRKDYYGRTQYPNHPVINVSWYDAQAYCEWRGARLPSEAEWEKAARGGLAGKLYSWGDDFPVCTPGAPNGAQSEYCPSQSDMAQTMAVGNFVPNGYGLFDMIGNAAEWVNDWYESDYYSRSPDSNPMGPGTNPTGYMIPKVVRGGAYESSSSYLAATLRVATRGQYIPEYGSLSIGFRCAASP
ncbi:MAG: formylglycine-generating enzyme family protein [Anaerolineales bacterium]|nr:formylglycine-generating enzyme family protein [Anaerolineales bacterium]